MTIRSRIEEGRIILKLCHSTTDVLSPGRFVTIARSHMSREIGPWNRYAQKNVPFSLLFPLKAPKHQSSKISDHLGPPLESQ